MAINQWFKILYFQQEWYKFISKNKFHENFMLVVSISFVELFGIDILKWYFEDIEQSVANKCL